MTERQLNLWLTPEMDKWREEQQSLPDRVYPIDISNLMFLVLFEFHEIVFYNFIKF